MSFDFTTKLDRNGKLIQEVNTEIVPARSIGQTPVSQALPILRLIAAEYNVKLSTQRGFRIASNLLKNSAKNN